MTSMKDLGHAAHYLAEVITQDLTRQLRQVQHTVESLQAEVDRLSVAANDNSDRYLNQKEAAAFLGVSGEFIRLRRKEGVFPEPVKIGRSQRWTRSALVEWAQSNPGG